jgi:hypothetical protein
MTKEKKKKIEATGSSAKVNGLCCPSIRADLFLLTFFPHSKTLIFFLSFPSIDESLLFHLRQLLTKKKLNLEKN